MLRITLLGILLIFITACGGSGGGNAEPAIGIPDPTGTLSVTVTGLPDDLDGAISVAGPNGYSQSISATRQFTGLTSGNYTVVVNEVMASGIEYQGFEQSIELSIAENTTSNADVVYGAKTQSLGVISGFGSVFVNGIRFNSDNSIISTDDIANGTDEDLDVGMNVSVTGLVSHDGNQAKAEHIKYSARARGPIEEINLAQNSFTLLGLVFLVDDLTEFKNTDYTTLLIGDPADVSAILNGDNQLLATRVKKLDASDVTIIIRGKVTLLDEVAQTFTLDNLVTDHSLIIDYSLAQLEGELASDSR